MQPKSKLKHNKKRNTAFLYETLVKELTRAVVEKNEIKKQEIVGICKQFFNKESPLHKELQLYTLLNESANLEKSFAERLVQEAVRIHSQLDKEKIYSEQTKLINTINKKIGPNVFSNFLPDYKNLATIYQIFSSDTPVKERILLEQNMVGVLTSKVELAESQNLQPIDSIVFSTFAKKFNEKYSGTLLKEQKELLSHYVMSGNDGGTSLNVYLNEEIGRIKEKVNSLLKTEEFTSNSFLLDKTKKLSEKLEDFKKKPVDHKMLEEVLKIQSFINEATK